MATLIWGVKEPEVKKTRAPRSPLHRSEIRELGAGFWLVTAFGALLSLARFSEAFLLLRADNVGLAPHFAPMLLVGLNVVYMLTAYPVGKLSDRIGRRGLLAGGLATLAASVLAGWAWDRYGAPAPFYAGAVFCIGALGVYAMMNRHVQPVKS